MILCPTCRREAYEGTLFCAECGASLAGFPYARTVALSPEELMARGHTGPAPRVNGTGTLAKAHARLALEIKGRGVVLPQADRPEYSLGRSETGQAIVPDVDLAPYGATEAGVSRVHAILKVDRDSLNVLDYASTNGTQLNGIPLQPHVSHDVRHGDELRLGKLRLRVLWRP